jgi:pilus assembly protein CpaC
MNATLRKAVVATLGLMAQMALAAPDVAVEQPAEQPAATAPAPAARPPKAGADDLAGMVEAQGESPIALYNGEVKVLDVANVTRIAVGKGDVLKANVVASNQVVLIGAQAGTTSLRVWTRNGQQLTYRVTVRAFDMSQILRDVQDLLAAEPGISVKQVDGHVLIEGDYTNPQTATRIQALQQIYPEQIVSTVPVPEGPQPAVKRERMVYMEVRVVEIMRSALRNLGVNWDASAEGPQIGGTLFGSKNAAKPVNSALFGISTNLRSRLDLMERAGESWTLAEPTVSCKSGGSAKFTVGGEIPVPVSAALGTQTIIYKEYGVIMEFKPIADDKGNISSSIVAEVSQPDSQFSNVNNNGLVAFTKTRTETEVALRENQTLVISGLLKNSGNRSVNGIPGAKDVPVLGNLFKSKQYQNDRTELVVMVTPRSVEVANDLNDKAIANANQIQKRLDPVISKINSKLAE